MRVDTLKACVRRVAIPATLIVPLSAFSCDLPREAPTSHDPSRNGKVMFALELADHSDVSKVEYVIDLDGDKVRDGNMKVNDQGVASVTEANLRATDGYTVDLRATRKLIQPCTAITNFVVAAGTTTPVPVTFQCDSTDPDEDEAP